MSVNIKCLLKLFGSTLSPPSSPDGDGCTMGCKVLAMVPGEAAGEYAAGVSSLRSGDEDVCDLGESNGECFLVEAPPMMAEGAGDAGSNSGEGLVSKITMERLSCALRLMRHSCSMASQQPIMSFSVKVKATLSLSAPKKSYRKKIAIL